MWSYVRTKAKEWMESRKLYTVERINTDERLTATPPPPPPPPPPAAFFKEQYVPSRLG